MKKQSGQVLLITVMLLATALTIALSVSFTSQTETQITKLEQQSQEALSAAEAGIEQVLKTGSTVDIDLGDFSGSAEIDKVENKTVFVSPLIQKDDQYTFYLDSYDAGQKRFIDPPSPFSGSLEVYYGTQSDCKDIALELTMVYDDPLTTGYDVKRFIADIGNKLGTIDVSDIGLSLPSEIDLDGQKFNCKTSSIAINGSNYPNVKVLIVRSLFNQTNIGFKSTGSEVLKSPGTVITSTAQSTKTGVTKKVELFQSYPQIPSEFFVTSF